MLTEDVTENSERMKEAFRMFDKVGMYSDKSISVHQLKLSSYKNNSNSK